MTMVAARGSIRSSAHAHACMHTSSGSISQLSSGGQPGHGRWRQDQFAEPQANHQLDRRIALRTRGLLRQVGGSPFPIALISVPDERFAKQTHFALRGPEPPDWPSPARRVALKAQVVAAYIDVTRAWNVHPVSRLLQNKANLSASSLNRVGEGLALVNDRSWA